MLLIELAEAVASTAEIGKPSRSDVAPDVHPFEGGDERNGALHFPRRTTAYGRDVPLQGQGLFFRDENGPPFVVVVRAPAFVHFS